MKTNEKSSESKIKSPINDIDYKVFGKILESFVMNFPDPGKFLKSLQKKDDSSKNIEELFLKYLKDPYHRDKNSERKNDDTYSIVEEDSGSLNISPKLSDMKNAKEEQKATKNFSEPMNLAPLVTKLKTKRHWIVEKDPDLEYKFTPVSISESGCFILPDRTNQEKLVIGLTIKLESQDLHYRHWHNILVGKQGEPPSALTKNRLREEMNRWITPLKKTEPYESYWFSDPYKVEVESKSKKAWSLPCFTFYISTSHLTPEENRRFIKFNRRLRQAQKSALEILDKQYDKELEIRKKNPWLNKNREDQWKKALASIKKALSRSIKGWQIDYDEPPVLFEPRVKLHRDILANGDSIWGHITLKQVLVEPLVEPEKKPSEPEPPVHYIVIIKNEDLIDGCESREKFLSERYAALISLIDGNKNKELPVFDGLIEVFSLQDKRKDLWKKHLNLTEFHPDEEYNPISLLVEMGGDVFYEPILVNNEQAYSVFYNEMLATGNSKKNTDK